MIERKDYLRIPLIILNQKIAATKRNVIQKKSKQQTHPNSSISENSQDLQVDLGQSTIKINQEIIKNKRTFKPVKKRPVDQFGLKPFKIKSTKPNRQFHDYVVYGLGEVFVGERTIMHHLGIDVGTKTVVVAYMTEEGDVNYISEINGYWVFENATAFVRNLLNDPNKTRSDGTKRPARWIELDGKIVVLGRDAEELAYAKNDTLLRPMAEGSIAPDQEAMTILASIVQGLIETAEKEVGKFEDQLKICYCTTAPAINKDFNIAYHKKIVDMIIEGYDTETKISSSSIKESHAIVLDMNEDEATGIGISWGAGTVTVSYVKYGMEIYSFCYVGAGDWIDSQVAMRHGYDEMAPIYKRKKASETPTTVSKRKMNVNLSPGNKPNDRVDLDIYLHYEVLISNVVEGIVAGFVENENEAKIGEAINIYMAGGTSSPEGFVELVSKKFSELELPFQIGEIKKAERPLFSVATGCLKAAQYGISDP
jgi:actin-like ATPase involved in cell morphogenesis